MAYRWTSPTENLWQCTLSPRFCTVYVTKDEAGGFWPQVNGRQITKAYPDLATAQRIVIEAARRLLTETLKGLES
jgi:hypothetical protein